MGCCRAARQDEAGEAAEVDDLITDHGSAQHATGLLRELVGHGYIFRSGRSRQRPLTTAFGAELQNFSGAQVGIAPVRR